MQNRLKLARRFNAFFFSFVFAVLAEPAPLDLVFYEYAAYKQMLNTISSPT